jgi:hypothetical protein
MYVGMGLSGCMPVSAVNLGKRSASAKLGMEAKLYLGWVANELFHLLVFSIPRNCKN